jgi:hypothetical protein
MRSNWGRHPNCYAYKKIPWGAPYDFRNDAAHSSHVRLSLSGLQLCLQLLRTVSGLRFGGPDGSGPRSGPEAGTKSAGKLRPDARLRRLRFASNHSVLSLGRHCSSGLWAGGSAEIADLKQHDRRNAHAENPAQPPVLVLCVRALYSGGIPVPIVGRSRIVKKLTQEITA